LICISSSPIQFADAFLESRYPKCVKIRWRSNIARSHTFSDVVMSEGIKGMSPAKCLDDSEEVAGSKMIPSNYTPACRKLCFCTSVARLNHHNIRHAPLLRLARPLSSRNFCTRVISPGTILSRRLIEKRRSKAGPHREHGIKMMQIFSGKIIRGPCKSLSLSAERAPVAIKARTTSHRSTKGKMEG